jgi:UBA/TS-N domain
MLQDSRPEVVTGTVNEDFKAAKPLPPTAEEPQQSIVFKKVPMNDSHKTARSLPPNDEALQLMSMGFSQRQSIDALQRFDNDLERATNYLLDSPPPTRGDDDLVPDGFGPQDQVAEEGMRQERLVQKNQDLIDTSTSTVDHSGMGFEHNDDTSMRPLEPTAWNASIEGMSHESPVQKTIPAPTQMTYDNAQFEPERPVQTEPVATEEIGSEEDFMIKYEETDLSLLSQYATEYQKAAISAKRAGDKTSAIDLLRKSKAFTAKKEELKELQSDDLPFEDDKVQLVSQLSRHAGLQPQPNQSPEPSPSHDSELQYSKSQPSGTLTPPLPAKDRTYEPPKEKPSLVHPDADESVSHSDTAPPLPQPSPSSTPPLSQTSPSQSPPPNLAATDSSEVQKLLETLIVRQKEYKQAAIHYKDIGNLVVAKEMIRVSKEVLQTAVAVKNKQLTAPKSISNKIPPPPDMDLGSGKPRQVQEVELTSSTIGNLPDFSQLEKTLSYQVDVCHNLELQNRGKAGGSVKLGDAFKGLAKAFAADAVSLKSTENTNAPLPRFHYQNVAYAYRETHPDIGSNEMVINIKKATKLQSLETAAQDIEAYVQWDLGGWPPENVPQAHLGKGQTPSAPKGANPGVYHTSKNAQFLMAML